MTDRVGKIVRNTAETQITIELNIDGTGNYELSTGNGMFEHLLAQLSRHGLIGTILLRTLASLWAGLSVRRWATVAASLEWPTHSCR